MTGRIMTNHYIERVEKRQVVMTHEFGQAVFLDGTLWVLDMGVATGKRSPAPLPSNIDETADRITGYIEFLQFVRGEVRRLKDGAQEANE